MVIRPKTVRGTCTCFLYHLDNDNIFINKPLEFLRGYIFIKIFHFQFLILSSPQNMQRVISVSHHGNRWSESPQIILQCDISTGLKKSKFLAAILAGCIFFIWTSVSDVWIAG